MLRHRTSAEDTVVAVLSQFFSSRRVVRVTETFDLGLDRHQHFDVAQRQKIPEMRDKFHIAVPVDKVAIGRGYRLFVDSFVSHGYRSNDRTAAQRDRKSVV